MDIDGGVKRNLYDSMAEGVTGAGCVVRDNVSVAAGAISRPKSCRTSSVATPSSGSASFNLSTKELARADGERMIERMKATGIIRIQWAHHQWTQRCRCVHW